MKVLLILVLIVFFLLIFVAAESARELHCLKVKKYIVRSSKITNDNKHRIVFLSDYHETLKGKLNDKIIHTINKIDPELILIGGDMICGAANPDDVKPATDLVNRLSEDYPVLLGLGNHEEKSRAGRYGSTHNFKSFFEGLKYVKMDSSFVGNGQKGIYFLDNASYFVDEQLVIKGLTIESSYYKRLEKTKMDPNYIMDKVGQSSEDVFCILMAHDPYFFDSYKKWGADLSLSGHNHGGMVRLPFLGGVISPKLFLFPKYDYGRFHEDGKEMIITSGLGQHSIPIRLFNYPEIVLIELEGL